MSQVKRFVGVAESVEKAHLFQQLGRIEASLDHLTTQAAELKSGQNILHKRFTHLDRQVNLWKGGVAVMTMAATLVGSLLGHLLK